MKAIIIGAGIGGLTTAIALEKQGIDIEIYEKSDAISAVGAGLSLWKNAIFVLEALGLKHELQQHAIAAGEGAIRSHTGDVLASMSQEGAEVMTVVVHRADLHEMLHRAIQTPIQLSKTVTHYQNTGNGVIAYFDDGTIAEGDILIAADGIHSPIRQQMFPDAQPIYSGYTAFRAVVDFEHARLKGVWGESWGIGLRFGITLLSGNRVYWFCTDNAPAGQRYQPVEAKQYIEGLYGDWHDPIADLIRATPVSAILHHDIYDLAPLSSWQDGRAVLLGDAAHAMTPNLGQGACQAIEDAYALAHCLANSNTVEQGIADYQAVRLPRAKQIVQQSRQIGRVGQLDNAIICWIRNQAVKLVPSGIRNQGINQVAAYDINRIQVNHNIAG